MTKQLFYLLFRDTFKEAFTKERIEYAFEKPRVWPYNPSLVIDILQKLSIQESTTPTKLQTPMTSRAVHRIHRQYKLDHSTTKLELILCGHERLAAQYSIDNYIINGLREAFQIEKKKRKAKAIFWKAELEARKAEIQAHKANAAASRARKLASKAVNASIKANQGKRKLVESNIEVGSTPVAKRVASTTTSGRAIITPARFVQIL
jgi:hypothetical protein